MQAGWQAHPLQESLFEVSPQAGRMVSLPVRIFLIFLLLVLCACQDIPADRLYALPLAGAPTEADWERALPRLVIVKGGRLHRLASLSDVDTDTVHTSTASCHHGAALPEPLPVDLRAFYTAEELFLRLSWADATPDEGMREWLFDGEKWTNTGAMEDGFGLLWDAERRFPRFTCAFACHIRDFAVAGASFRASNRMQLVKDGAWLDLWNWKAQRTGHFGFADDRFLDQEGMHGDVPGELFQENSRARLEGAKEIMFAEGDRPIYDAEGLPVGRGFRLQDSTAPGYLTSRPTGGRGDVAARGRWEKGRWTVVLRRRLDTGDRRDVRFIPGDREGIPFGLSIMDHTLNEHYASVAEETIVLLRSNGRNASQK